VSVCCVRIQIPELHTNSRTSIYRIRIHPCIFNSAGSHIRSNILFNSAGLLETRLIVSCISFPSTNGENFFQILSSVITPSASCWWMAFCFHHYQINTKMIPLAWICLPSRPPGRSYNNHQTNERDSQEYDEANGCVHWIVYYLLCYIISDLQEKSDANVEPDGLHATIVRLASRKWKDALSQGITNWGADDASNCSEREHTKGSRYALPNANSYRPSNINDSFPRYQQQALAMNHSISNSQYPVVPVWTPPTNQGPPAVPDENYSYTMPENTSSTSTTISSWEDDTHSNPQLAPNGIDIPSPHQYGEQIESETSTLPAAVFRPVLTVVSEDQEWRPQADFSMLSGNLDDRKRSSYGSNSNGNAFLPVPNYPYSTPHETLRLNTNLDHRGPSDDVSSAEPVTTSTASYFGDTDGSYNRTPLSAATTPLSPSVRSVSRGRGSASPSGPYRVSPYATAYIEKRWSAPVSTGYGNLSSLDPQLQGQPHSHHSSPICAPSHAHPQPAPSYLPSNHQGYPSNMGSLLPGPYESHHDVPAQLMCSPWYIPSHNHADHPYAVECPNLYACLSEEQIMPPESDMNPEDPEMVPHEQDLRFEGDLYTPRWVRGHGNKREGWCGICKPGRWLVLKNSAFWYDKSFTHGISAATGRPFEKPREMRRMDGNPDVWEGLCHTCSDWVPLVSNKKKGTTWFRHAYKCHTHSKVRDAPKRRRESSHGKATNAATIAKAKASSP
jgi:hypothetical protein